MDDELSEENSEILLEPTQEYYTNTLLTSEELHRLYLAKCRDIRQLPAPPLEKRWIDVTMNKCTGFTIDLAESGFGAEAAKELVKILEAKKLMRVLNLSRNNFRDSVQNLVDILNNSSLESIDLRSVGLNGNDAEALFKAMKKNDTLTSIDLSGISGINRNHIGAKGAAALSEFLSTTTSLKSLALGENGITTESMQPFSAGLLANRTLEHLDLSSNHLRYEGMKILCESLVFLPLKTFLVPDNLATDLAVPMLSQFLRVSRTLTELDLSRNNFTHRGAEGLAMALRVTPTLTTVNLSFNRIGDIGARFICDSFRDNPSCKLRNLNLSANSINGRGAIAISELLAVSTTLTKLDLRQNIFDDAAGVAMARALEVNLHLKHLDLSGNKLGNETATTLGESLQVNATLAKLILANNAIRDPGAEALAKGLRENPVIIHVDMSLNDFDYRYAAQIQERCNFNQKHEYSTKANKYKKTIEELNVSSRALHKIQNEIAEENLKLSQANETIFNVQQTIDLAESEKETDIRFLQNAIAEQLKLIKDVARENAAKNSEASKIRAEREQSYRYLLNKYHREKDVTLKLERKLRNSRNDYENTKIKCTREIRALEKSLIAATFDKNQAKEEAELAEKDVEEFYLVMNPPEPQAEKKKPKKEPKKDNFIKGNIKATLTKSESLRIESKIQPEPTEQPIQNETVTLIKTLPSRSSSRELINPHSRTLPARSQSLRKIETPANVSSVTTSTITFPLPPGQLQQLASLPTKLYSQ